MAPHQPTRFSPAGCRVVVAALFTALVAAPALPSVPTAAAQDVAPGNVEAQTALIWKPVTEVDVSTVTQTTATLETDASGTRFQLDRPALEALLAAAPLESETSSVDFVVPIPMPDGSVARFRLEASPSMDPELAARFPEVQSYRGFGIDDPTATLRCDLSPNGFHAFVISSQSTFTVLPTGSTDPASYNSSAARAAAGDLPSCGVTEVNRLNPGRVRSPDAAGKVAPLPVGGTRRTYRFAVAATWEFCNTLGGGTTAGCVSAINTFLNGINAIYERELSVHLNLVNDTDVIYSTERGFNAGNDPYTNGNTTSMLSQVVPDLNANVGSGNFDIGHVVGTNSGGLANLGVVCASGKGGGASGLSAPAGNTSSVNLWAHEIGHQFGQDHTFNGTDGNCGGDNRNPPTAWEPGSGNTTMSYSGICSTDNNTGGADVRFHVGSFEQSTDYIVNQGGGACAANTNTGNAVPTVSAGSNRTIPKNTPFTLTATGGDADAGDVAGLTYAWEQLDAGGASFANPPYGDQGGDPANTTRPLFRALKPSASSSRTFPSLTYILNNANTPPATVNGLQTAESLPQIGRTLNFRATIRDQRGGVNTSAMVLTVDGSSGPFRVTAPNTAVTWTVGSQQTVTWNVAGTTAAPVSAANVAIKLSTDGGQSFPITLSASTPNDGSQQITVPAGLNSAQARVKVEAVGNVFFDVSDVDFSINAGAGCPFVTSTSPNTGNVGTTLTIKGSGFTGATGATFSGNVAGTGFSVQNDTTIQVTIPAGATTGPITITEPGCPGVPTGTVIFCSGSAQTLAVDDGSAEDFVGPNPGFFVNRLTPSSYPATLRAASLEFASFTVPNGTALTVLSGANPGGGTNVDGVTFQSTPGVAVADSGFVRYDVPALTIASGDFVVGYSIGPGADCCPSPRDKNSVQGRSYSSGSEGAFSTNSAGNFLIRAEYLTGCSVPQPSPTATSGPGSTPTPTPGGGATPTPSPTPTATGAGPTPTPGVGMSFYSVAPCRLVDTRFAGSGGPNPLGPSSTTSYVGWGVCGIDANAVALSVNVTVAGPQQSGFLTIWPSDKAKPVASSINFVPGKTRANNAFILISADVAGTFSVFVGSPGSTHLLVDVNGYFK